LGTRRIQWIDTMKAVAILLVVFGHYVHTHSTKAYVYSFHMHLFFFVAGLVYSARDPFKTFLVKRIRMLLVPYFVFSGLQYGFFILRRYYGDSPDLSSTLTGKLIDIVTWNEFWFLGCLFVVSIAFYFLANVVKSLRQFVVFAVICTALHYLLTEHAGAYIHENLLKCFPGLVFYALGFVLREPLLHSNEKVSAPPPLRILLLLVPINVYVFALCYQSYGLITISFNQNYLYFYTLSLTGILIVYTLSRHIKQNVIVTFIGTNTILIYLLEGYPPAIVRRLMIHAFGVDNFDAITTGYAALYTVMTVTILTPCILFIVRYMPFLIGKSAVAKTADDSTGSRKTRERIQKRRTRPRRAIEEIRMNRRRRDRRTGTTGLDAVNP